MISLFKVMVEVEPERYELRLKKSENSRPKQRRKDVVLAKSSLFRFDEGRDREARLQKVLSYDYEKSEYYGQIQGIIREFVWGKRKRIDFFKTFRNDQGSSDNNSFDEWSGQLDFVGLASEIETKGNFNGRSHSQTSIRSRRLSRGSSSNKHIIIISLEIFTFQNSSF